MEGKLEENPRVQSLENEEKIHQALMDLRSGNAPRDGEREPRHKILLGSFLVGVAICGGFLVIIRLGLLDFAGRYLTLIQRIGVGATAMMVVLTIIRLADYLWVSRIRDRAGRYNLRRFLRLVQALLFAVIVISILFANWYTAVVSLGLISLILGFALQTPTTSFIGWIYILIRKPYRVGDRIQIGESTGDVIEVSYLDTTLWEFGGPYLSTDQPSGRAIKFPNSNVLSTAVYNYSWDLFPYIWNEVKFQIAYNSDFEFVARTMQEITEAELGEDMITRVAAYRKVLEKTPVEEIYVQEKPTVFLRVSENTWIEAIVRYLVDPKSAAGTKTRLIQKMLSALNREPDRVLFPKGENR